MDWLTRLPVIGPWLARLMRTHAWRAYEHLESVHWTRLAAAITFTSFVALFPLLTVGAAVAAALLSPAQIEDLEDKLAEQVPGIADQLDISGLVANAGTVGVIAGALLLVTGIGWVGSLRDCLRAVWAKDDDPGNPVKRKLADAGVLIGLGGVALLSAGCSAFATAAVGRAADHIGLAHHGPGRFLLTVAGFCIAVLVNLVIMAYMLTWLPRVTPERRAVLVAGLIGAVGFELLKALLSGYMQGVATRSLYGAFGVPIALLLWMNFIAKLLLYCAAWTATQHVGGIPSYEQQRERRRARDAGEVSPGAPGGPGGPGEAASAAAPGR
ncbi:YihY/virulence factor BrkB family protein [Streptomyces sp. NBC_01262]|uniref:YihY/virulence factor BrkB family protein n=1 Tax=Streptomyces sp. NBC_01262 TaxID=2903803 RepID=UPI002E346200|nr:YihY/virulence factor BrkB family protein [Streptomyces sp. NBC_01262]